MKRLLWILPLLLLFSCNNYRASRGPADWIYVSATGNDVTGDGTSGNPFATVSHAATTASNGDTIYVQAGTITETAQFSISEGISLYGEGIGVSNITVDVSDTLDYLITMYSDEGSTGNHTISNLTFDFDFSVTKGIEARGRSNINIHDCEFKNSVSEAISLNGKYSGAGAPTTWGTGFYVTDCIFTSCGHDYYNTTYSSWFASAALSISGDQGAEITGNYINNTDGRYGEGIDGIAVSQGYHRGLLIEDNVILLSSRHASSNQWNFAIELWNCQGGITIRNNYMRGMLDFGGTSTTDSWSYGYAALVEGNVVEWPGVQPYDQVWLTLESDISGGVTVTKNRTRYVTTPIAFYQSVGPLDDVYDVTISYNIWEQTIYAAGNYTGRCVTFNSVDGATYTRLKYLNNVQYVTAYIGSAGFHCGDTKLRFNDTEIKNNAFYGSYNNIRFESDTIRGLDIWNNSHYNHTNATSFVTCDSSDVSITGAITANPLFKTGSFRLQSGSPLRDAGISVSLTSDIAGHTVPQNTTPDIGAYEYGDYLFRTPSGNLLRNANGKLMMTH